MTDEKADRKRLGSMGPVFGSAFVAVFAWFAFTLPDHPDAVRWTSFLRVPIEVPLILFALVAGGQRLGGLLRYLVTLVVFVVLGLKLADIATQAAFQRPFNPHLDAKMLADGWILASGTIGAVVAAAVVAGVVLAISGAGFLFLRSARAAASAQGRVSIGLMMVSAALFIGGGVLVATGQRGAEARVTGYLGARLSLIVTSMADMRAFEAELAQGLEPRSGEGLFSAVKGKDVIVIFVESYGRSALDDPRYAKVTGPRLDAVEQALASAGLKAASAWVTSPTVGGLSWLAHGTLLSGLWVNNQARYDLVTRSGPQSLNRLFGDAGWTTVAAMPAITMDWPEAAYFGYDLTLAAADLGYRGKPFNWVTMPDQYTLSAFERLGRAPAQAAGRPVMAEVALISSHAPWTPVARLIDWDAVGDGTVFNEQAERGDPPSVVWADPERIRRHYIGTIDYALEVLGSYMQRHGDNTVFVILGDHQPAAIVTGPGASRAVPFHVVSGDTDLVNAFKARGFVSGMRPGALTAEWPMNEMRAVLIEVFGGASRPEIRGP